MSAGRRVDAGSAHQELAALQAHGADLDERLRTIDQAEREAARRQAAASAALTRLEHDAVAGGDVTAAQRKKAEDDLARAQAELAAPFAERACCGRPARFWRLCFDCTTGNAVQGCELCSSLPC
jgi:hypothetical protein